MAVAGRVGLEIDHVRKSRCRSAMKSVMAARVSSLASRCGECLAPGIRRVSIGACTLAAKTLQLVVGAVWIVGALQCQDRHPDGGQEAGDVEGAEPRVQPGVVPAPERDIDVAVVAREALAQVAGLVRRRRSGGCWRC